MKRRKATNEKELSSAIKEDADEIEGIYSANGTKKETLSKGLNIIKYKSGKTKKIYK